MPAVPDHDTPGFPEQGAIIIGLTNCLPRTCRRIPVGLRRDSGCGSTAPDRWRDGYRDELMPYLDVAQRLDATGRLGRRCRWGYGRGSFPVVYQTSGSQQAQEGSEQ
jgi:hypothetical protein